MNTCLRYCLAILALSSCLFCSAEESEPKDTVYFYNSWDNMLDMAPMMMLDDAEIIAYSPYTVNVFTDNEEAIEKLSNEGFIAYSIGDSIWLANALYLRHEFSGDVKYFEGSVPLFFNEKIAYLTFPSDISFKEILFGDTDDELGVAYFYIDFENKKIKKVTYKFLSELLEDYHDLQMRYEGMKDYKKKEIIEYFFFKYIERVTADDMRPSITEFTGKSSTIQ